MSEKKVYLLLKVSIDRRQLAEFNEYWARESLPYWLERGAKHVGSFVNYVGEHTNEILRIFEFDGVPHWEQFEESLRESERGRNLLKGLSRFNYTLKRNLLRAIYE